MPNKNNTGPNGEGAMTGRKLGNCVSKEVSEETTRPRFGRERGNRGSVRNGNGAGNRQPRGNGNINRG